MIMQQTPIFAPLRWIMMCLVIIDMLFVWHQHSYNRLQNEGWSLKKYMYISSFFIAWMILLQTLDLPQGKVHVYILDWATKKVHFFGCNSQDELLQSNDCGRGTRYPLMKWHITSWLFTKFFHFSTWLSNL